MPSARENRGCLGALIDQLFGSDSRVAVSYPYRIRDDFLSPAELSLFHVLRHIVGSQAIIITKVRLADLFFVQRPHENRSAFNRIAQRHIDFLLCQSQTMQPLLGIELDDASHARADRVESDAFLDRVFAAAGLPLLRIPAQRAYNTHELADKINPFLALDCP